MTRFPIIDCHQDLILHVEHKKLFTDQAQTSFQQIAHSQIAICLATVLPYGENWHESAFNETILLEIEKYTRYAAEYGFIFVRDSRDMEHCLHGEARGLLLHIEGMNAFRGTSTDWPLLDGLFEAGVRSLGIVHTEKNLLGGGNLDSETGLTELGKGVLQWCLNHGIVIDLAHMNTKTFFDAVQMLEERSLPLFVSHGNAYAICADNRNYTDEQLALIGKSEGCIGIFLSKRFVSTNDVVKSEDVVRHVRHIAQVAGDSSLAIGSDFGGVLSGLPVGLESVGALSSLLHELEKKGYDEQFIHGIAHENAARVVSQYLPHS